MLKNIQDLLITPLKSIKFRYLPLLMIYFAFGASFFTSIAETVWVKEELDLSATVLLTLGVWLSFPWNIKMVFGQCVDSIPLFGSNRKVYVFIAAGFMTIGTLILAAMAGHGSFIERLGSKKELYFIASLLSVLGLVLQDVVADAMTVDVVDVTEGKGENARPRTSNAIRAELGMVQLLGRLAMNIAIFMVVGLGGWLAQILSFQSIFLLSLFVPLISITGCLLVKLRPVEIKPINWKILGNGLAYAVFVIWMGLADIPYNQEIVFVVSLVIIVYLLRLTIRSLPQKTILIIFCSIVVIFVYRAMPSAGPGVTWWYIDVLHFDKAFLGTLSQIGSGLAIAGLWFGAKAITEKPIGTVLAWLTVVGFIVSLPTIFLFYGLAEWTTQTFGFGARTIAIIDTTAASPFVQLSMIPLLTLTAIYAPRGNAATWFALMASLMNLALTAGTLFSKYLNQLWVVTREVRDLAGNMISSANYTELGDLMIASSVIGLIIPLTTIFIFMKVLNRKNNHAHT